MVQRIGVPERRMGTCKLSCKVDRMEGCRQGQGFSRLALFSRSILTVTMETKEAFVVSLSLLSEFSATNALTAAESADGK